MSSGRRNIQKNKNRTFNLKLSNKSKQNIMYEFKFSLLDRKYHEIVEIIAKEIRKSNACVLTCFYKINGNFKQNKKEFVYIKCLSKIVEFIDGDIEVYFDEFGKIDFERKIINEISNYTKVKKIIKSSSNCIHGVQLADNCAGIIRKWLSGDELYFEKIRNNVIFINFDEIDDKI